MKDLRKKCKAVIDSCTTLQQMKSARRYIELSGLSSDMSIMAWYEFKYNLIGEI